MAPRRQTKQPAVADGESRQGRSRQVKAGKRENEVAAGDESANPPKKLRGRQKNAVASTTAKNEDTKSKSRNQAEKAPEDVVVVSSASEDEIIEKKTRGRKNTEKAGNKATKSNAPVTRKSKTTTVENDGDPGESTVGEGSTKRSTRRAKKTVDESDATAHPISAKAASKKRNNTKAQVNKENEREKARERRSRAQGWIWLPKDLPAEERRRIMMEHAPITKKKKEKKGKTIKLWLPKDLPAKKARMIAMEYMNSPGKLHFV